MQIRLSATLAAVVHLTLHKVSTSARGIVLSRTPNLKDLLIREFPSGPSRIPSAALAKLQRIHFDELFHPAQVESASHLLSRCGRPLQVLSLILFPALEPSLPSLLSHIPSLKQLSLAAINSDIRGPITFSLHPISPALLAHILSSLFSTSNATIP